MNRSQLLFVSSLVALVLSGCAYGRHLSQGNDHFQRGDYTEALLAYRRAQSANASPEVAGKIAATRARISEQVNAAVPRFLAAGEYGKAIDTINSGKALFPDDPSLPALIAGVSSNLRDAAAWHRDQKNFAEAERLLELLARGLPSENEVAQADLATVRANWVSQLAERGGEAQRAGRAAEALLLFAKAAQLAGEPHARHRDALWSEVAPQLYYSVELNASGIRASQVVAELASRRLPPGAGFVAAGVSAGRPNGARVAVSLSETELERGHTVRTVETSYQAGVRQVENPAYLIRQRELRRAQQKLAEWEAEEERAERALQREGGSYSKYNRKSEASDAVSQWSREVQEARRAFDREEPLMDEPIYGQLAYPVTLHRLRGSAWLEAVVEHADGRPPVQAAELLEFLASDDEHSAQPVAGISADPLELPSAREVNDRLASQAVDRVLEAVLQSFNGYRQGLLAAAASDGRNEALVRYVLSDPGNVDSALRQELTRNTGIPDAIELLAAGW